MLITDPNYLIPMQDVPPTQQAPGMQPSDYDWVTKPFGIPPAPEIIPQLPYKPGPPRPTPGSKGPAWWNFWSGQQDGQQRAYNPPPSRDWYVRPGDKRDRFAPYSNNPFQPKPPPNPPGFDPGNPMGPMPEPYRDPPWWQFWKSDSAPATASQRLASFRNQRSSYGAATRASSAPRSAPKKQAQAAAPRNQLSGVALRGASPSRQGVAGRRPM